ncbi:MAG TPA: hypothetical protein VEC37_04240 [Bacillota bacterium]|nr:hypothetical protein [Bacillota bacterium]
MFRTLKMIPVVRLTTDPVKPALIPQNVMSRISSPCRFSIILVFYCNNYSKGLIVFFAENVIIFLIVFLICENEWEILPTIDQKNDSQTIHFLILWIFLNIIHVN